MSENDSSVPTPEQRKHWRLMAQWEHAEELTIEWEAVAADAKARAKKWRAKADRLKALLDTEEKEEIERRCAVINADWAEAK